MVDLSSTIAAKSDQLNADDLMGGRTLTIKITRVAGMSDKEQPIAIYYEGDGGKPYKPGKSMRRVLVNFWGKDGESYVGRMLTLFRDPNVEFGGIKVGGLRISHMSDLGNETTMALAVTRGAKRRYEVKALRPPQQGGGQVNGNAASRMSPEEQVAAYIKAIRDPDIVANVEQLADYQTDERRAKWLTGIRERHPDLNAKIIEANSARFRELAPDDGGAAETDEQPSNAADDDDDRFPA